MSLHIIICSQVLGSIDNRSWVKPERAGLSLINVTGVVSLESALVGAEDYKLENERNLEE